MSLLSKAAGWLFGGSGGATAEKALDVADKAFYTEEERSSKDAADLASARAMQSAPTSGRFDSFVDGVSRLVRPGVTLWLCGGFIGWWTLPDVKTISEYWQNVFMIVLTFWFGGRAILKDLPQAIRMLRGR